MANMFVGDTGTEVVLNCGVDITTATVRKIRARKPDGKIVEWPATQNSTTEIVYSLQAGDLDKAGQWEFQAYIEMPGWKGRGQWASVVVQA